jgi:4-amino-4-deoxy-L-arabinose transferase-like glycosyltransferase
MKLAFVSMRRRFAHSLLSLLGDQSARRLRLAMLATIIVAAGFAGNLNRGLLETTEGRYAECAREMLESGNYVEPTLDYEPHSSKPPMAYWSMVAGMLLLGPSEAGVRLASGVAFIGTVLPAA